MASETDSPTSPSDAPQRHRTGRTVLLTGATGFVGRHLYPVLVEAGHRVRCGTRSPEKARERQPDREWVEVDVEQPHTLEPALEGCDAAYFLIHRISSARDYREQEVAGARDFAVAAEKAGVERIVYLGGVQPAGEPSRHLLARLETGRALREGPVPTAELRAAMVIGAGGASWEMVYQLSRRLPIMILPRWLRNRSQPVLVDDAAVALLAVLDLPPRWNGWMDVPGPAPVSHRELLRRVADQMGYRPPLFDVPVVTPRLSSYWIGMVTSADLDLARELVEGLTSDLLPDGESVWERLPEQRPADLDRAVAVALEDHRRAKVEDGKAPCASAVERLRRAGRTYLEGPPIDGWPPRTAAGGNAENGNGGDGGETPS